MDKYYKYFISYISNKGYGNAEVGLKRKIKGMDEIKEIENYINSQNNSEDTCVMFYSLIDEYNID